MGKRGVGALKFKPARSSGVISNTAVTLSALVDSARQVVQGNSESYSKSSLAQIIQVGTSAGGARAKAVISWNPTSNEIRPGQFDVESGFEHWLLKFDGMGQMNQLIDSKAYGRVEYAYSQMAITAGIAMSPCRLLEENGRAHFMTRRFDREGHSVNGKFFGITREDFLIVADRFGIGSAPEVLKQVEAAVSVWPDFAKKAGLSVGEMERIWKHHRLL